MNSIAFNLIVVNLLLEFEFPQFETQDMVDVSACRYGYTPVDSKENAVHLKGGKPPAVLQSILDEANVSEHHFCTGALP